MYRVTCSSSTRENNFHKVLKMRIDAFVNEVHDATINFPKDEVFGVTSQLRRAALSVALNYTEGYARQRKAVLKNFLEMAYGSLKEAQYLLEFSFQRKHLLKNDFLRISALGDQIGKMLWGTFSKL